MGFNLIGLYPCATWKTKYKQNDVPLANEDARGKHSADDKETSNPKSKQKKFKSNKCHKRNNKKSKEHCHLFSQPKNLLSPIALPKFQHQSTVDNKLFARNKVNKVKFWRFE